MGSREISRRAFVSQITAAALTVASAPRARPANPTSLGSADNDLIYSSATKLAALIRSKAISSDEVVRAHLRRIEAVNPRLNAVCQLDPARAVKAALDADAALASGQALGPLHGVPITIKDSFDTEGIVSTAGTTGRRNFLPPDDATVVTRLRAAGAIILGKTNTPELTLSYETDNLIYGKTNHPWDLNRTPGGSSGGAASIIAVGGSPADIGSDTAGSIRVPAHFCGIAGLKPTFGRVSRTGHIVRPGGVIGRQTHVGPMARSAEDLALLLRIISGPDSKDPDVVPVPLEKLADVRLKDLRICFFTSNGKSTPTAEITAAVRAATKVFADEGCAITEGCLPGFDLVDLILKVNIADAGDYYRTLLRDCGTTQLHPDTAAYLERVRSGVLSGRKYSDILLDWARLRESALKFMDNVDLLICPAASAPAPKHGGTHAIDFSYSYLFNLLGWPAAVLRAGTTADGLPVGVQIIGRLWKDHEVLAAAARLEQSLGGWKPDFSEKKLLTPPPAR